MRGQTRANKILNKTGNGLVPTNMKVTELHACTTYQVAIDEETVVRVSGVQVLADPTKVQYENPSIAIFGIDSSAVPQEYFISDLDRFNPYSIFLKRFDAMLEAFRYLKVEHSECAETLDYYKELVEKSRRNYALITNIDIEIEQHGRYGIHLKMMRNESENSISRIYILKVYKTAKTHSRKNTRESLIFLEPVGDSENVFDGILIYTLKENKPDKIIKTIQMEPFRTIIDYLKKYNVRMCVHKILKCGYPVILCPCQSLINSSLLPPLPVVII